MPGNVPGARKYKSEQARVCPCSHGTYKLVLEADSNYTHEEDHLK